MKKLTLLSMIAIVAIVFNGCEKDNISLSSNNPTNGRTTVVFNPDLSYGTLTDQDGNTYKTITIGTQTWMAENLRTTKYNDGAPIPNVINNDEWYNLETGAYCTYNNTNDLDTIATYGRLYNYYAVNTGNLAPKGWHVPTDAEWTHLTDYLGGEIVAYGKLRETGTTHCASPNTGVTNENGFTALPGGTRDYDGTFISIGYTGYWWSATESNVTSAWDRGMLSGFSLVGRGGDGKEVGLSVRCVRD